MKEKNFAKRLLELRKKKGLNQTEMGNLFGVGLRALQLWENNELPSGMKLNRIENRLKELEAETQTVQEPQPEYKSLKRVPYFELDVSAGNIEMFTDTKEVPSQSISIPGFDDCDIAMPIYGNSMYPTYESGVIVMCKKLRDKSIIQYGESYLIVTGEQRMIKRIQKGDRKEILLAVSDNESVNGEGLRKYESFEIPRDKILHLYIVKGCIKRNQI